MTATNGGRSVESIGLGVFLALPLLMAGTSPAVASPAAEATKRNLLADGGFERPTVEFAGLFSAGEAIGGWRVTRGTVDILDSDYWRPAEGDQSLDLAGVSDGTIRQHVRTKPGRSYLLSFALADVCPEEKRLRVSFDSRPVLDMTLIGGTLENSAPDWRTVSVTVTSTSRTSELSFRSLSGDSVCGPILDDVALRRLKPSRADRP